MKDSNKARYRYNIDQKKLYLQEKEIPVIDFEQTEIGNCHNCNSVILSLSHHFNEQEHIILSKCESCDELAANIYDLNWNWLEEVPVFPCGVGQENSDDELCELDILNSIPKV